MKKWRSRNSITKCNMMLSTSRSLRLTRSCKDKSRNKIYRSGIKTSSTERIRFSK